MITSAQLAAILALARIALNHGADRAAVVGLTAAASESTTEIVTDLLIKPAPRW